MTESPLVSVLMPVYNADKYVKTAIQSLLDQSYSNWELLILNDGSTDNSKAVIQEFTDARIKYSEQQEIKGYLSSCNSLFERVSGSFLTFLDADDTCHPKRLETCLFQFKKDLRLEFLTTDFIRVSEIGEQLSQHNLSIDYSRYANDPNYAPTICCATIFLRTDLLKKVGGYHPFFKDIGGEDYHWLFRLSRAGKGKHSNEVLYNYRTHSAQSHHLNKNPLKYYFAEIDKEIRWSLIHENFDQLQQASDLKNRWLERIDANPSDLLFKQASSMLNRNKKNKAVRTAFQALIKMPFSFTSWYRFLYLNYSALLR